MTEKQAEAEIRYRLAKFLLFRLQESHILDLYHDEYMLAVSKEDYQQYMNDPVHPTLKGYKEWWAPKFIDFCEKLP